MENEKKRTRKEKPPRSGVRKSVIHVSQGRPNRGPLFSRVKTPPPDVAKFSAKNREEDREGKLIVKSRAVIINNASEQPPPANRPLEISRSAPTFSFYIARSSGAHFLYPVLPIVVAAPHRYTTQHPARIECFMKNDIAQFSYLLIEVCSRRRLRADFGN